MRVLLLAALFTIGCEQGTAEVQCQGNGESLSCSVRHVAGSKPLNVCFEFRITCANGTNGVAKACQDVDPGQTSVRIIRDEDVSNFQACDKVVSSSVASVVVKAVDK